jgi:Asp-tRNA(Asn)/Glu-tRNA(Gln) amidotransferase A subunit family amidase
MINITSDMSWQDVAATAQAYRDKTIAAIEPKVPEVPDHNVLNVTTLPAKLLSPDVVEITELPTETLLDRMATGNITSTQVTKAFLQRAGLAGKLVNCITEVLPERALKRAAELDKYYATHGKPVGPLHGLPISVKEHIGMKGLDLNAGFISWVGKVASDDGLILKLLWNAGCVFHARTTEPQTLMHLETSSNIYGVTVNPYNTNLTSGGSSGGEGALLGIRGSCLGIGTDIGGSIRSPAANQGLFGLKPTSYRLPLDGFAATMFGQEQIVPVIGPLSTSLEGIKIFMKTLIDQKPWLYEPSLVPIPWRETNNQTVSSKPLPPYK